MARILLAEDDSNISIILQLCLERIGKHTVVVREDGQSALETALTEPFDLILLDGMMPKKDGLEVARELLSAQHAAPIIFLSAKSEAKEVSQFLALGRGYIAKPFNPQTICATIDEILAGKRTVG